MNIFCLYVYFTFILFLSLSHLNSLMMDRVGLMGVEFFFYNTSVNSKSRIVFFTVLFFSLSMIFWPLFIYIYDFFHFFSHSISSLFFTYLLLLNSAFFHYLNLSKIIKLLMNEKTISIKF